MVSALNGIRTFETATRYTFDLNAIPVLKNLTHLPVIADPSHAVAKGAVAAGADGIIVEVHPDPRHALSDGKQSLSHSLFVDFMHEISLVANSVGRSL
jgi:3-deoxy-7-phosphoheptulonate synthase